MIKASFFDLDTLIDIDSKVWIVSKLNPNIPIMKISKSDFNLIRNGIFKKQGNKIEFNGHTYWLPNELSNKLKVKLKVTDTSLANIGISMQEFLNKDVIDNMKFDIKIDAISHLKNTNDDIYVICSKQTVRNYTNVVKKLEDKLKDDGLQIKNFYYITDTFYNQDRDEIRFKVIRLLLQHLVGYKTKDDKFIDEEITRYDVVNYFDTHSDTMCIMNEGNTVLRYLLNKTEDGLKSVIKEDISEYCPTLIVNQITDNYMNKKITNKLNISPNNIIKTFEGFNMGKYIKFKRTLSNKSSSWVDYKGDILTIKVSPNFKSTPYINKEIDNILAKLVKISNYYKLILNSAQLYNLYDNKGVWLRFRLADTDGSTIYNTEPGMIPSDIKLDMMSKVENEFGDNFTTQDFKERGYISFDVFIG